MNSISNFSSTAAQSAQANYRSSNSEAAFFENDKFRMSSPDDNSVLLQNKQTGEDHHAVGDFGQSDLSHGVDGQQAQGGQGSMVDQIVRKVIEAVCQALGIDPAEILGESPEQGGGHDPSVGSGPDHQGSPWGPLPSDNPTLMNGGPGGCNVTINLYDYSTHNNNSNNTTTTPPPPPQDHFNPLDPIGLLD